MGNLPLLVARGESIPEAWENSLLILDEDGLRYKRDDPDDLGGEQLGARMAIEIANPDHPLLTHLCENGQTASPYGCLEYILEIMGVKNTWRQDLADEDDTKWEYTYDDRLENYPTSKGPFNQIEFIIQRLVERPWSRRTNAITWIPEIDTVERHTPCFQRMTFEEVANYDTEETSDLSMDYTMRSRNVVHAAPDNMKGFYVGFMCRVCDAVRERSGRDVRNGSLIEFTDNYHVSPRDRPKFDGVIKRIKESRARGEPIEKRAWTREYVLPMILEEKERLVEDLIKGAEKYAPPEKLDVEIEKIKDLSERAIPMLLRQSYEKAV